MTLNFVVSVLIIWADKLVYQNGFNWAPLLDNISIDIPPRTTLGIVGESGSGKTTLLRLVNRLLDPQSGELTIDGQNLKHAAD